MRSLLVLFLAGGCWTKPTPVPAVAAPMLAKLPRCQVELAGNGHLMVAGNDLGVLIPDLEDAGEGDGGNELAQRLAVYQTGSDAYVSYRDAHNYKGPGGSDVLWHIDCGGSKLDELHIDGADFGHAALHPDRKRLFYSAGVVRVLDLATKKRAKVTSGGTTKGCWVSESDETDYGLTDTVSSVSNDYLMFERGGPCGFEAEYESTLMRKHLVTGAEEKSSWVTSVMKAGSTIWLAEGSCSSHVMRSTDWKTWTEVKVPTLYGAATIAADASSPQTLIVASGPCGMMSGGNAAITRDGGATWKEIESVNGQVAWARGTTIADLQIWTTDGQLMRWDGTDFVDTGRPTGDKWPAWPKSVEIGGRTLNLTSFGLIDNKTGERLYPR
jgi:hypothetical protein